MAHLAQHEQPARPEAAVPGSGTFKRRLADFDTPGAVAWEYPDDPDLIALVHDPRVPMRLNVIEALGHAGNTAMMPLHEQRVMEFGDHRRLVSLLQRPFGQPVLVAAAGNAYSVPERDIRNVFLPQIFLMIRALHEQGVTHRALDVRRFHYKGDDRTEIVVSECFSAPPGSSVPVIFETVERGLADPMARGDGSPADDYYAMGAALLTLLIGRDPKSTRRDDQIMIAKISQGSYTALCGGQEISGSISLLLRGLLTDNPEDRWGAAEVVAWMNGSPPRVHGSLNPWALSRPVALGGRSYTDRRLLAHAMSEDVLTASAYIRRHDIAHWISHFIPRTVNNQDLVNMLKLGDVRRQVDAKLNTPEHVVARFCALLDPVGPIRFRGMAVMPDGLGPLLAQRATDNPAAIQSALGLIEPQFSHALTEICFASSPEERRESRSRFKIGSGQLDEMGGDDGSLFRVVYGQNAGLPCASPQFDHLWVQSPKQAMVHLDKMMEGGKVANLADPHIVAFLIARTREASNRFAGRSITAKQGDAMWTELLQLYGMMQNRYEIGPLKALSASFAARIEEKLDLLRCKSRRNAAKQRLAAVVKAGAIFQLAEVFDIAALLAADERGWRRARQRVHMIDMTVQRLSEPVPASDIRALHRGSLGAAVVSSAIFALSLLMRLI